VNIRRVTFDSADLTLVGQFHVPDVEPATGLPALVFTGPLSAVKEQVTGTYAARLAAAGFATLSFDHRNFGESQGRPRQHEDAAGKQVDLQSAVSWLAAQPEVSAERIGACGICLGASYALRLAAFDPRVKALALVGGAYNDPAQMRRSMGPDGYRGALAAQAAIAQHQYVTGAVEYLPAISVSGGPAMMGGAEPAEYYGTDRSASPYWVNQMTVLSMRELITLDAVGATDFVSPTPTLVVHGTTDAYLSPETAQAVFDRLGEPKDLMWLPTTNHIDLYDVEEYVGPAVNRAAAWFHQYL
jgi:fermentation-respiration switch protein FrsA (DUF1100 family)